MSRLSYWIPGPPSLGRWQGPSCSVTDLQWRDIAGRWEERRGSDCSLAPRPLPPPPCVIAALSLPPQAQQPLFRHRLPVRWRWSDCTAYLSPGPSATRQCTVHCPSLIHVRAHPDFMPSDAQRLTDKLAARPPCFQPWQGCASVSVPWALLDLLDSGSTRGQTFSGCVSCPALPRAPASPLIYPWVPSDDDTKQTFPEGGLRARGDSDKCLSLGSRVWSGRQRGGARSRAGETLDPGQSPGRPLEPGTPRLKGLRWQEGPQGEAARAKVGDGLALTRSEPCSPGHPPRGP